MILNTNNFKEALNDKFLRIILYIAAFIVVIFFAVIVYKAALGKHVKVFGIEINIPEEMGSFAEVQQQKKSDQDTSLSKIPSNSKPFTQYQKSVLTLNKLKETENEKNDTVVNFKDNSRNTTIDINSTKPNIQSIQGKNVNVGNNYGQVGDKYYEEKILTQMDLDYLLELVEKEVKVGKYKKCFFLGNNNDSGRAQITKQVLDFLISKGYTYSGFANVNSAPFDGFEVEQGTLECFLVILGSFD